MCVILYTSRPELVTNKMLTAAWKTNNHGGGYTFVKHKKWVTKKGFLKLADYIASLKLDRVYDSSFIIHHFRIGTHGKLNKAMTHPFNVGYNQLYHNGIIYGLGDDDISDTAHLAQIISGMKLKDQVSLLGALAESTDSKFVLTDIKNNTYYSIGHFVNIENHVFASNNYFLPARAEEKEVLLDDIEITELERIQYGRWNRL